MSEVPTGTVTTKASARLGDIAKPLTADDDVDRRPAYQARATS